MLIRRDSAVDFLARQASEQYLTSAQFLAQLLRQVISRPQVTQILLGSDDLLPLNPLRSFCAMLIQRVVIVMGIGTVVASTQFHRHVLIGVRNTLHA